MKVKDTNSGLLCNFEVLDLLGSRGADQEAIAAIGSVTPSECKVYDYLSHTAAGTQSRESLQGFFEKVQQYSLTKAERLQIVNIRPTTAVEVHLIVEDCEERMSTENVEQFLEIIESCLPAPPEKPDKEEKEPEDMQTMGDDEDQENDNDMLTVEDE